MAFIRRVRTKSGATAVQVARYVDGRQEIVKHFGSAHTAEELSVLVTAAREWLEPEQIALDLDVTPEEPIEQVPDRGPEALFSSGELAAEPAPTTPARTTGPGRTVGTGSLVLREVLEAAYGALGFDDLGDEVFRDLVIARIVEPTSKRDAGRVVTDLGKQPVSYATIKRRLGQIGPRDYRGQIAYRCFDYAAETGGLSLVLYDVTTLYFEAEKEDQLRKVGYSKERRVDPQIVVGP